MPTKWTPRCGSRIWVLTIVLTMTRRIIPIWFLGGIVVALDALICPEVNGQVWTS